MSSLPHNVYTIVYFRELGKRPWQAVEKVAWLATASDFRSVQGADPARPRAKGVARRCAPRYDLRLMNAPTPPGSLRTDRARHRFTLADSTALVGLGVLPMDRSFELIDGDLIEMPADGPLHRQFHSVLFGLIAKQLPDALALCIDQTLPIDGHNGPKPDLYVFPAAVHARDLKPADVLWVVEIADTSLDYDCKVKGPLYAKAGIPEFWVIDANAKAILRFSEPDAEGYRTQTRCPAAAALAPACAPGLLIQLSAMPRLD
jgi:Uma2 family endonuclease